MNVGSCSTASGVRISGTNTLVNIKRSRRPIDRNEVVNEVMCTTHRKFSKIVLAMNIPLRMPWKAFIVEDEQGLVAKKMAKIESPKSTI